MEGLLILILLYLVATLVVFPIWVLIRIGTLRDNEARLRREMEILDEEIRTLRSALRNQVPGPEQTAAPAQPAPAPAAPVATTIPPKETPPPVPVASVATPIVREVVPDPAPVLAEPAAALNSPAQPAVTASAEPPVIAPPPEPEGKLDLPPPPAGWLDNINWEQFMGAKLFAWLGGLALLLGVAFFVKYSFEHNWITPEMRVAAGFMLGTGLIVGGLRISREKSRITADTLVATGLVSLYVVTFACRSIYHFPFFGQIPTFLVMALITTAAFILAVRLEAHVVAILGILGGFLTPKLVSTGVDNPLGLFGYIALLDLGLVAVALHRRWAYLVPLGAAGTVITMIGWAAEHFAPEKTTTAMVVCLVFSALFLGTQEAARRWSRESALFFPSAVLFPAAALGFAWIFLGYPEVAGRTGLLFGFIFLASLPALRLAWTDKCDELVAMAAGATAVLLARWTGVTFTAAQAPVLMTLCLGFCGVYLGAYLLARRKERATDTVLWTAAGFPFAALAFAWFMMGNAEVGARPGLLFGFMLAADAILLALAWLDDRLPRLHLAAGLAVFALLTGWTARHLTDGLLPWALAASLVFAALHTVFPLLLQRRDPDAAPTWWSQLFPPLTLLLMLVPIVKLNSVSFLVWPAILIIDLLAIMLAVLSASLAGVAAVLVLTLLATGVCIFKLPAAAVFAPSLILVIGFFAVFFFGACLWLMRKLGDNLPPDGGQLGGLLGDPRAQLPAFASLLPFTLLIMACARLHVPDPSAVFGLGLLLVVLTLGLARLFVIEWLPACALAGVTALELTWHARHFEPAGAGVHLAWYLGFYAVFAAFPFLFRREFARLTGPWAVAALSGIAHFWMAYQAIKAGWPNDFLGAIPAVFALAPLASLFAILNQVPADNPKRLNQLAWFGGVALLFITLIFPIQFDRQWLTVAWALEGVALLWLFHRVPHPGLSTTGAVLLAVAFARLALNPAVLGYHVRGATPIFNWYLYAYGLVTAALFAGARLAAPPRDIVLGIRVPPVLGTLGVVLAFLLLNIEIADYFTAPGARSLVFQFSGNFGRDMTYTIAWALFALALLGAGLWRQLKAARYAGIALLSVALLKLFLHDLARLEALYRIGALFAVAVIAIVASFAYQRFLPGNEKSPPP